LRQIAIYHFFSNIFWYFLSQLIDPMVLEYQKQRHNRVIAQSRSSLSVVALNINDYRRPSINCLLAGFRQLTPRCRACRSTPRQCRQSF